MTSSISTRTGWRCGPGPGSLHPIFGSLSGDVHVVCMAGSKGPGLPPPGALCECEDEACKPCGGVPCRDVIWRSTCPCVHACIPTKMCRACAHAGARTRTHQRARAHTDIIVEVLGARRRSGRRAKSSCEKCRIWASTAWGDVQGNALLSFGAGWVFRVWARFVLGV